jgi:hypothetical protein
MALFVLCGAPSQRLLPNIHNSKLFDACLRKKEVILLHSLLKIENFMGEGPK